MAIVVVVRYPGINDLHTWPAGRHRYAASGFVSCIHHLFLAPTTLGPLSLGPASSPMICKRSLVEPKLGMLLRAHEPHFGRSHISAAALLAAYRTTHARVAPDTSAKACKRVPEANSRANAAEERGRPTGAKFDRSNAASDASRPVFMIVFLLDKLIYQEYSCLLLIKLAGRSVIEH